MRRFKLIKRSPMLHDVGIIATLDKESDMYLWTNKFGRACATYKINVEEFPEFWEEIFEKEYEVLSETSVLLSGETKIHSVKRLLDGEIFMIGDNTTKGVIYEFNEREGFLEVHVGCQKTLLRTFDKVKQPLFTTEDGKEIFKGDTYHIVQLRNMSLILNQVYPNFIRDSNKHLRFSTKEAAENYVVCNKPCLSFREVNETVKRAGFNLDNNIKIALKELVKSK